MLCLPAGLPGRTNACTQPLCSSALGLAPKHYRAFTRQRAFAFTLMPNGTLCLLQVPLWAAVVLAVIKVPLQFGNMRITMSAAAVSAAPASAGHGEVMSSTEAWLRAVSVELLAVATTLGCHTYLWREFGRRRQSKRLRLEDGQGQGQPQQQQHEQEHEEKQGARAAAAKGGMAQANAAAADEAGMKVEEHGATMAAVAAGSSSAAATQQAWQVQQPHRPQEGPPLQQPCQRPPPYRAVCRRTSLVVKVRARPACMAMQSRH